MKSQGFSAIDLFAGAGGFSLSAINAGAELLAAVELDRDACETYRKNIRNDSGNAIELFEENIKELDPYRVSEKVGLNPGDLDLLLGGPPCQGFSTHRILSAGVGDPRNQLLLRYFDYVKVFQPKIFLVENVPGLLWKRHELYLQRFKNLSRKHGYQLLGPIKLNAKDYGVPQNRNRVFMLGVKKSLNMSQIDWPPKPTHSAPDKDELPSWNTASTVFERAPNYVLKGLKKFLDKETLEGLRFGDPLKPLSEDPNTLHMNHSKSLAERFRNTPINGSRVDSGFVLPCHSKGHDGHLDTYGRIRLAQPGPTMTTGCTNPSKGRFLHPWKNHGITVRHAARFQTFPDEFEFIGGIISQSQQIGNAVPVEFGVVLIRAVRDLIAKTELRKRLSEHG